MTTTTQIHSQSQQKVHVVTWRGPVDLVLWSTLVLFGGMLTWLSLARYTGYNAGMLDLGNMAQAIASVRRGQPLVCTFPDGPISRLALHVEFIYFLLALPYALWPDPRLLLIIQAGLFVSGIFPVYRLTLRRTDSRFAARCLVFIYLLYPTAQTSVLFDVHGDTLAMPLLLFVLDALDRRAWRTYGLFLVLALSCKFYVALPVATMGFLLWWSGERRVGLITLSIGVVYGAVAFLIIRLLFTTTQTPELHSGFNYLLFYFGQVRQLLATLDQRLLSAIVIFGPALFLAWHGKRWLLPSLPVAAAALLSTGPGGAYDYRYHHYATVVPFILMAAIVGVEQLQRRSASAKVQPDRGTQSAQQTQPVRQRRRNWRGDLGLTLAIVIICNVAFVDTPLNPLFWMGLPGYGLDASAYGNTSRDRMKDHFLAEYVPSEAPLAASTFIAPHLANRETLYVVRYPDDPGGERLPEILPRVDYVLADSLFDYRRIIDGGLVAGISYEVREIAQVLNDPAFDLVAARDGLLLFQRDAPAVQRLDQQVEILPAEPLSAVQAAFGDTLALVNAEITPLGERRFQAMFTWHVPDMAEPLGHYVAVSELAEVPDARMVHLPTYAMLPTTAWQPGQIIRETFEVELPTDIEPGQYAWRVGWYNTAHSEAYATDERSRLEGSETVVIDTIEVTD